jgi:hypothetical protein
LTLSFSLSVWSRGHRNDEPKDYLVGATYTVDVEDLRPTQFRVGEHVVEQKYEKIENMSKEKRKEYFESNKIPVVVGPKGRLYLIDRHHFARAVEEAGYTEVNIKVLKNWSSFDEVEFWQKMRAAHFVYQNDDVEGRMVAATDLPKRVADMKDDPFRSLAGDLRDEGYFNKKPGEYFIEFKWARALRRYFTKEDLDVYKMKYKDAMKDAREFAGSPQSLGLAGRASSACLLSLQRD